MAARWGTGEETLTACNMDFFPLDTLDETDELSSRETLEALQSCLDLSFFEDTPTIESKVPDHDNDATLLAALTEILDNVEDENLSPFDILPDSDLLSGQKGREQSPLRKLLGLSHSPTEKDAPSRPLSTGKSLPRIQTNSLQRSDGEEEEDGSLTLSPVGPDSCPDADLLDLEGLSLLHPLTLEQTNEDCVSISLGDLVRHMQPYCLPVCVENEAGEQIMPEGGIVLEVVDQGENGEPILAIPDINLPVSLKVKEQLSEKEQKVSDEAEDSSEHIVVDDEDDVTVNEAPVKITSPETTGVCLDVKDEKTVKSQMEEIKEKSPSRRKKKCKQQSHPYPVEGRVLRSSTARNAAQELPKEPKRKSVKEEKKQKLPKVPPASTQAPSLVKPKEKELCQTETQPQTSTTAVISEVNVQQTKVKSLSSRQDTVPLSAKPGKSKDSYSPTTMSSQDSSEASQQPVQAPTELGNVSAAPPVSLSPVSSEIPTAAPCSVTPEVMPSASEAVPPAVPEPKPKALSLEEYRRLRQQKRPAPVEKQGNNSTKWPSLPELPKELPPIPCLPHPSPKDPRRPITQPPKKEVEEVKPAWQPRGPCAPPTPEALLVPPAYMVAPSSKVSAATSVPKPQQTPEPPSLPQKNPILVPNVVKDSAMPQSVTTQPAAPNVPKNFGAPNTQLASSVHGKCSPALTGGMDGVDGVPISKPVSPKCEEHTKTTLKTTTDEIKPTAATGSLPSVPQKTTVVSQKVPEVTALTSLNNIIASDSKSSKSTADVTQLCSTPAASLSDSQSLKTKPVVAETKETPTTPVEAQRAKSPTQELIEAFTSEIGIEAADLTSLLEQFEETQAKEEQCVSEVSGRAAAVGNSSVELVPEKSVVKRVKASDISSTAALTPPATPPHQMWKPLAAVALLGKSKASEASKSSPSKVIQIEAQPLPSVRPRSKPTLAAATVAPDLACLDHDYCLPNKGTPTAEPGKRWNIKQQSFITIKPIRQHTPTTTQTTPGALASSLQSTINQVVLTKTQVCPMKPLEPKANRLDESSVMETPDASPTRLETELKERSPRRGPLGRSYRRHAASRTPSPGCSPEERTRGRSRKRSHHSPSPMSSCSESDSDSSRSRSRSHSPTKKRYRHQSSSSSSSRSSYRHSVSRSPPRRRRYSYSSSRSGSWSRSRSRSLSPQRRDQWSKGRRLYSPSYRPSYGHAPKPNAEEVKRRKEKAIEERRIVYVGKIRGTMTQKELKERFSYFGEIEECTLHFRDHGDNYGFVTYYNTKDAFTAIENGSKLRKPDELPFDLCFGGRRQFCQSNYADLDSSREYEPTPAKGKYHALDFDTLLRQAQQNLKR
ncbi:peroxisome proliferator-activated receptor gamma coactivator-related protein 1 [Oreochromis aureus]|uniref:RRM domain-containing protein n=1 Tax=Oreochromis aureus TaxID=47969 RepID=A0A668SG01_OREAU|nr:peroxisome proliferator-activated receptor gamma coactivator-related protein 1 [Oreochromis aureus]